MMTGIFLVLLGYGMVIHLKMEYSVFQKISPDVSCVLILGAQLKTNEPTTTIKSRLKKGADLLKEYPELKVIVTGGKGTETQLPEAMIMRNVLIHDFGIDANRIIIEDQAHNTFENLLLSKPLLLPGRVAIVTNEFHTVRTGFLAKRLRINAMMIGARTPFKKRLKWELREHLAIYKSLFLDVEKKDKKSEADELERSTRHMSI